ncbi:MAG: glycoside hydrolase family 9 protein [Oscillospiraceae bacterium]|nr:glycoside hydrolase family 9 protein [Oscillospiraceae bacterium]
MKKAIAFISGLVMCAAALTAPVQTAKNIPVKAAGDYNYAEALQKSMFFYEVQQSGKLPEWNSVPWRADSMVDESGKETDFVPGGWFDAGDHFKFTLTNAYSASMLAWGYLQYKDAVDKAGLGETYRNNIQWGLDYVNACYLGEGKLVGTIGDYTGGSTDHNIWCSAEVYLRKHHLNNGDWERPYDIIENSSVAGLCAAALAEGYLIFKDDQPDKAAAYLKNAKELFEYADKWRSADSKDAIGGMSGFYNTSSWLDDCMYAAGWLYKATGDKSYIDKIEKDYLPNFPTENQSTDPKFTWGLCWDDTCQAAVYLYADITGNEQWKNHVAKHIEHWIEGGGDIKYTSDGLAWLFQWGCLRHATTTAWLALLSADTLFKEDASKAEKYRTWAKSQMDYCFGDNSMKMSYVLGMGDKNPTAIHHRTASGIHDDHWNELGKSTTSEEGWQTEYAHTLYGALIGGPDSSGNYDDEKVSVSDYQYTEVAIDYNAGYTAALCAMIADFPGGKILDNFPPREEPKWAEWEVAAVINGQGDSYTEVKAWAMNHTAWPARVAKDITYRYYFNIEELTKAGLSADNITVEAKSQQYQSDQQGFATVEGPIKYAGDPTGNTYYAEVKFADGRAIQPTGQSEHRDEVQFRVSIPDAIDGQPTKGAWDPSNDWSYEGLDATDSLKNPKALNEHICMYVDGNLVWGTEPDGTKPSDTPVTTPTEQPEPETKTPTEPDSSSETDIATKPADEPSSDATLPGTENDVNSGKCGDVNLDGTVDILDVIALNKYLVGSRELDGEQRLNAEVYKDNELNFTDSLTLLKHVLNIVKDIPVTP